MTPADATWLDRVRRWHLQRGRSMGRISFALTAAQCRARTKTETRRTGFRYAQPGKLLIAVDRVMGFRKGERVDDIVELFGVIRLLDVQRESLGEITVEGCAREGFPELDPRGFVELFAKAHKLPLDLAVRHPVTVLRFAWLCAECGQDDASALLGRPGLYCTSCRLAGL